MKIVRNSEAQLEINLRLLKNAEEKSAEEKMWNERMEICPKIKIFNRAFFEQNGSSLFVKFVTF